MTPLNLKKKESDMIRIKPDGSIVFLHEDKITEALMNEPKHQDEEKSSRARHRDPERRIFRVELLFELGPVHTL